MSARRMTPKGQMTRGSNSGPAVMMMPPHIRATFMPNPPLKHLQPLTSRRKHPVTGVAQLLSHFEKAAPKERICQPTPKALKEKRIKQKEEDHQAKLGPLVEEYRQGQRDSEGKHQGMNCYNTLFVGRLAYEVTERKLLREMESFGPVRDIKLVLDREGKSAGFGFVEYENEEDMKRAYRAADGMKIEGRELVVDVERGHTVPTWLPRRLGGGLGGSRIGGKDKNITIPGRFDPNRPEPPRHAQPIMEGAPGGMGRGRGPEPAFGGYDDRNGPYAGHRDGPQGGYDNGPPPYGGGGYGPRRGDRGMGDRGGQGDMSRRRRRSRSRSPERRYAPRPRY